MSTTEQYLRGLLRDRDSYTNFIQTVSNQPTVSNLTFDELNGIIKNELDNRNGDLIDGLTFQWSEESNLDGELEKMQNINILNLSQFFKNCFNLTDISMHDLKTSKVTNISLMCDWCNKLNNFNIVNCDFSNVKDASYAFAVSNIHTLDCSFFNNAIIENIDYMFGDCDNLLKINNLDKINPSKLKNMNITFSAEKLEELNGISNWNTCNLINMGATFNRCFNLKNLNLANWNTNNLTVLNYTFGWCDNLINLNLANWKVNNLTNLTGTFSHCQNLKNIIGANQWNTSKIKDMSVAFDGCANLDFNFLTNWNTSNVTALGSTFSGCFNLNNLIPLANWNTSNLKSMAYTFTFCNSLTNLTPLQNWNTSNLISLYTTFLNTGIVNCNLSKWNVSKVEDFIDTFENCFYLKNIDISGWNPSSVTSIVGMFSNCNNLTNASILNIINFVLKINVQKYGINNANLMINNYYSPFRNTKYNNSYYTSKHAALRSAGWTF